MSDQGTPTPPDNEGFSGSPNPYGAPPPPPPPAYGAPTPAAYGAPGPAPLPGGVAQAHSGLVSIPGLGTVKVATIGQRFLARLIDGVIFFVLYFILGALGLGAASRTTVDQTTGELKNTGGLAAYFLLLFVLMVASLAYEVGMIAVKGQTLGKMAMGVKVVLQANGGVPGFGPSFIRWVLPAVGSLLCGIGALVVYISPLFDSSGRVQGWHDKAANDLVISTK